MTAAPSAASERLSDADVVPMARAIALASKGRATSRPNPPVGCVLVRDGDIVGEGWHQRAGEPHAEVVALNAAGTRAAGATAYVTLEPCAHQGRTPPCADALADARVAKVVFGVEDPGALAGGGRNRLEAAGVNVAAGLMAEWVERQTEAFLHKARTGLPHLGLKLAQTPAGQLVPTTGRWITGVDMRTRVHELRSLVDAVVVGVGTVLADDPRLDVRDWPTFESSPTRQPRPVVLDSLGRTPITAQVVRDGAVILTSDRAEEQWSIDIEQRGAEVVRVGETRGELSWTETLEALADRDVQSILIEGGGTIAASAVAQGHVSRLYLHVAPGVGEVAITPAVAGRAWRVDHAVWFGSDLELSAVPA